MDVLTACGLGAIPAASVGLAWLAARQRNIDRWLPGHLRHCLRRPFARQDGRTAMLLCVADHFEPRHDAESPAHALDRTRKWLNDYPKLFGQFRDSDGKPPRHTFFYPIEQYDREEVLNISELCFQGFGELEVHLHHDNDTSANLRKRLTESVACLAESHGLLARDRMSGATRYGFIHGDWALGNSRPDGTCCGVDDELSILKQTGCYADFTYPSAPERNQPRRVNEIVYANCNHPKRSPQGNGVRIGSAPTPENVLMLIPGPLTLDWRRRKAMVLPRIENACLQYSQPPSPNRVALWLSARVQVPTRPDWYFVKLHTHGAPEQNQAAVLGRPMQKLHEELARRAERDPNFTFHYVTAREMYNLARAAEAGWQCDVDGARDYELVFTRK